MSDEKDALITQIEHLISLLRRIDDVTTWETTPLGRSFQDEVERAIGLRQPVIIGNKIIGDSNGVYLCARHHRVSFDDNFFAPNVWTEQTKIAYREWLARMPQDHPAQADPEPWAP